MMPDYHFIISGNPVAKGRARSARLPNGQTMHYTPAKTRMAENTIRALIMQQWGIRPPLDEAIELDVINYIAVPKSWSTKKRAAALAGQIRPTSRPDFDNYQKLACDALNGLVYRDDSLIVDGRSRKFYAETPRVAISINRIRAGLV